MRHYEVSFIVDPVLSGDEIKATAQTYVDMLKNEGASIVHVDEIGLKPLAYSINKRSSGVYFCVEFSLETGNIDKMELALRRDERIMRFLTVSLDKFGVKYNADKRAGKIGKKTRKDAEPAQVAAEKPAPKAEAPKAEAPKAEPAPKAEAPAEAVAAAAPVVAAAVAEAPAVEETVAAPVVEETVAAPVVEEAAEPAAEPVTAAAAQEEE